MTLIYPLLGGILIGLSSALLYVSLGRIAGVSGIAGGLFHDREPWKFAFLAGLLVAGTLLWFLFPAAFGVVDRPLPIVLAAGFFVGLGATIGNGCTSGHGVCGNARLSPRSIVATCTFIATGALTVFLYRSFA